MLGNKKGVEKRSLFSLSLPHKKLSKFRPQKKIYIICYELINVDRLIKEWIDGWIKRWMDRFFFFWGGGGGDEC